MLFVHITTRKLSKYNGKGRQTITLKCNLTLLFALKCYTIVFAPYNMTDWGTLEKNWNDTNGLEEKNNEWRIMARATAVGSHPFLGKISTFHFHCRLSCKDTCTCTCSKHIHSFWTNRIIVRWCSSQTYSVSLARASYIGWMKKISARHHRVIIVWSSPFLSRCLQKWRCKKLVKCKILSPAYNIEEFSSSHFWLFKLSRCFGIAREKT